MTRLSGFVNEIKLPRDQLDLRSSCQSVPAARGVSMKIVLVLARLARWDCQRNANFTVDGVRGARSTVAAVFDNADVT